MQSASFTGTLASGSQGLGGRVDARTMQTTSISSAGAPDYKVRRSGSSVDESLVDALDNVLISNNPFFDVRTYGAVGDGLTDDYVAFVDCYNAAVAFGGGIIFVPSGNYLLGSAFSVTSQKISIMGAGAQASIITSSIAAGVAITINAGASTFSGTTIQDLQITNVVSGANVTPLQIVSTPGTVLRNVMIKNHGLPVDIRSKTTLIGCDFTVPNSATAGTYVASFTSTAAGSVILGGTFTMSDATNTGCLNLAGANIVVDGAKLVASAITPGAGYGINVTAAGCKVVGCDLFVTGVAASYGIRVNADVSFYEDKNTFSGSGRQCFLATAILATTQIHRGSRIGRYRTVTLTAATTVVPDAEYEFNDYVGSAGWALTIDVTGANLAANGCRMVIRYNQTLGAGGSSRSSPETGSSS